MIIISMERRNAINPNEKVFVDTAAWIALLITNDELHEQAAEIMLELRHQETRLITSDLVLIEFLNALSSVKFRTPAISFVDTLRNLLNVEIIANSPAELENSLELYRARKDKDWSLTDCCSFIIMNENKISIAFTSDRHFEQAGFINLLS
jgi:predicted nucleic acid-binding protein